ncbi:MAG: hypothetical protein FJ151_00250 [Euryarchaeota archaeon]|nr:hypothetical protein [Euryarchaeota archaeon]
MDAGGVLRRLVHLMTPLFLVYYLLPDPLWEGGLEREYGLVLLLIIVLAAEALRLIFKPDIVGMREYERYQMCAAAWAAIGMTIAFLFFPVEYAAPALMGMGWVDPVIGILRRRKSTLYPSLPIALYFVIALASMSVLIGPTAEVLIASVVATPLAIASERYKSRYVDDDFLMIVVPLLVIAAVFALIP